MKPSRSRPRPSILALLVTLLCAATTTFAHLVDPFFTGAHLELFFLTLVVVVSALWGRWPGILAASLATLCYDFFFLAPRYSLRVSGPDVLSLLLLLGVAILVGTMAARLRREALVARQGRETAQATSRLARDLAGALTADQAVDMAIKRIRETHDWSPIFHPGMEPPILAAGWDVLPLRAPRKVRGHLAIPPEAIASLDRDLLQAWGSLLGLSLERIHFVEVAREALLRMEGERLRGHILSTLSHDLRTPLTSIVAQAQRIQEGVRKGAPPDELEGCATGLLEESRRMSDLVGNLLELSRLQSGGVQLRQEWNAIQELAESALRHRRTHLEGRPIQVDIPDDLPLAWCDGILLERVLVNLLDNAGRHTPAGTPLRLWARLEQDGLSCGIDDQGPGFPLDSLAQDAGRGGIGLSLCRAIAKAHGGELRLESGPGGGARVFLLLPQQPPPPEDPVEEV